MSADELVSKREAVEKACAAICFRCRSGVPLVEGGHEYDDGSKNKPWSECPGEPIRRAFEAWA